MKSRTNSSTTDPITPLDSAPSRRSADKTPEKEHSTADASVTLLVASDRCDHRKKRKRPRKKNCADKQQELNENSGPPLVNCDKNRAHALEPPHDIIKVENSEDDQTKSANSMTSATGEDGLQNAVLAGVTSNTCQECGRKLSQTSDAKHELVATHTVEKPTVCEDCDPRKCVVRVRHDDDHQQTLQVESKSGQKLATDSCNLVSYQYINKMGSVTVGCIPTRKY